MKGKRQINELKRRREKEERETERSAFMPPASIQLTRCPEAWRYCLGLGGDTVFIDKLF